MDRNSKLLSLILLISLFAGLLVSAGRVGVESAANTVQLVMDYADIRDRAAERRYNLNYFLTKLKENGLQSVALRERTLQELVDAGQATVLTGTEIADALRLGGAAAGGLAPETIRSGNTYILTDTAETHAWLRTEFTKRLGPDRVAEPAGNILELAAAREGVLEFRLGFAAADIAAIRASGLGVVPVFADYDLITPEEITAMFDIVDGAGAVRAVLFDGREVLGYPQHLETTAAAMESRGAVFAMVQAPGTLRGYVGLAGSEQLLRRLDYRAARVYMVSRKETNNIREVDMIERWLSAVKESNVRVLYLRPFYLPTSEEEEVWRNLNYVRDLAARLETAGYAVGPAVPFAPYFVPLTYLLLLTLGIAAGGVLLLRPVYRGSLRFTLGILALAVFACFAARRLGYLDLFRTIAAVAGAVIFAALAVTGVLQNPWLTAGRTNSVRAQVIFALRLWLGAVATALTGAILAAGMLGDIRYILELEFFRGVKVLYVLPLAIVAVGYLWFSVFARERKGNIGAELRDFYYSRVTVRGLLAAAAVAAVGAIYIVRSGNVAAISQWEWEFRTLLDNLLIARPRTKEFLFGHPALLLAVALAVRGHRRWLLPLFLLGTVGQLSILNTFVHIKTPLLLSAIRTLNGLWLGALVGVAAILLWNWLVAGYERGRAGRKRH
ncbi:MAG: DUF5693 family protein [bacterium]|jgi:hypothetical protein